jgi:hypothetical protein
MPGYSRRQTERVSVLAVDEYLCRGRRDLSQPLEERARRHAVDRDRLVVGDDAEAGAEVLE